MSVSCLVRSGSHITTQQQQNIHGCGPQHASIEAVAPEVKADNVGGFVERQHERQLLPVKIQGVR